MLRMRLWMSVYETLMLDVVAPEVHQNDCSYVCELLSIHHARISMVGSYMEDLKTVKIGGWALV